MDASEKHLNDELERALKEEEVTVQSETSTALSYSTEMEASRSMKLKDLEEKNKDLVNSVPLLDREIVCMPLEDEKYPIPPLNAGLFFFSKMPKCPSFAVSFSGCTHSDLNLTDCCTSQISKYPELWDVLYDMGHSLGDILVSRAILVGLHGTVQAGWCSVPVK